MTFLTTRSGSWSIVACFLVLPAARHLTAPPTTPLEPPTVTVNCVPRAVVEIISRWEDSPHTTGFRIVTDDYIIVSGYTGMYGQENLASGGPKIIDVVLMESFRPVAIFAELKKNQEPIQFAGRLWPTKNGQPLLYRGKKVMLLESINYEGLPYKVERGGW